MANEKKRGGRPNLKQDVIVERLRPNPAEPCDAQMLTGFLGRSVRDGYWRVYLSSRLDDYVEVAADDILESAPAAADEPMAGTIVWVRRDARLDRTTVEPLNAQGEFLGGGIADELLREMGPQNFAGGGSVELIGTIIKTISRLLCTRRTMCTGICCPKTGLTICGTAPCCTSPV